MLGELWDSRARYESEGRRQVSPLFLYVYVQARRLLWRSLSGRARLRPYRCTFRMAQPILPSHMTVHLERKRIRGQRSRSGASRGVLLTSPHYVTSNTGTQAHTRDTLLKAGQGGVDVIARSTVMPEAEPDPIVLSSAEPDRVAKSLYLP